MRQLNYDTAVKKVDADRLCNSPLPPLRVIQRCRYPKGLAIKRRKGILFPHLLVCFSGHMKFYENGKNVYDLAQGTCLFLPGECNIRWETHQDSDVLQLMFHHDIDVVTYQDLASVFGPLQRQMFTVQLNLNFLNTINQRFRITELSNLKNIMHSVTGFLLLEEVLQEYYDLSTQKGIDLKHSHLSRCINYIENNICEELSLDRIAENSYISVSRVTQLFREEMQMAPMQYVAQRKVELVKAMLSEGHSISETADYLGFNSLSYFSRFFKRQTGQNPSELIVR